MKTKQELLKELYSTLWECQQEKDFDVFHNLLHVRLSEKLEVLYNILGEEVDEEYWEEIEKYI